MGESASHKTCFPIYSKLDYITAKTSDGHDAFSLAQIYDHNEILDGLFQHLSLDDYRWKEKDQRIIHQISKAILTENFHILNLYPNWMIIDEQSGETILHHACTLGYLTTVSYLIERENDVKTLFIREKNHGFTPILSAVYAGQIKCFEYLLNIIIQLIITRKISLKTCIDDIFIDRYDRNLLHLCILSRERDLFEILLSNFEKNSFLFIELMIFNFDYNDETPLHLAVRLNLYHMCEYLIRFIDKLDEYQQSYIYFDQNDGELIRTEINTSTEIKIYSKKSRLFLIGLKNQNGQSSFHLSIHYGYLHLMNFFLNILDPFSRNYLLEHSDGNLRTPLHLASLNGYIDIVKQLFYFNVNIYIRDNQEFTPLHCLAQCMNENNTSIYILDIFLSYIQNNKKISFDLLTAINGYGHNCLETAIIARNRSFVEYLLNLNNILLFKNLLSNAQILDVYYHHIDTPLRKLITCMPDLAYRVLDIFITYIDDKHKILYDFQFLEDHCSIEKWRYHNNSQLNQIHKCSCSIFCSHKSLKFQTQFHNQTLIAYTTDPYRLVHNNVLSVMCKCAKQIDLKDQENEKQEENEKIKFIQYSFKLMHHPLCQKLMELKWKQFGLPLFSISFFIYCFYLILFTIIMLRNKQPEYFYRLVNASFPNGRHLNGTIPLVILPDFSLKT